MHNYYAYLWIVTNKYALCSFCRLGGFCGVFSLRPQDLLVHQDWLMTGRCRRRRLHWCSCYVLVPLWCLWIMKTWFTVSLSLSLSLAFIIPSKHSLCLPEIERLFLFVCSCNVILYILVHFEFADNSAWHTGFSIMINHLIALLLIGLRFNFNWLYDCYCVKIFNYSIHSIEVRPVMQGSKIKGLFSVVIRMHSNRSL